ncbi:MAG: permease-like cell division protein FtsX [Patescibacteria group bacterium]
MERRLITIWRIIHTGIVNFMRSISLAVAAMAVMAVTLTIVLFSIIANATFANTINDITSKITVSAYLKDETTDTQAKKLVSELKKHPNVTKVVYLNKEQATQAYIRQNLDNKELVAAITQADNPIPPTIQISPRNLNQVDEIKNFLTEPDNKSLQTADSPSYNDKRREAIDNIAHATNVLRKLGIISVAVFALTCILTIFNTIQMAIFNRRDEIQIMRLLGASTSYIRGPFIVESAIYGLLSAVFSILIVNSAFLASSTALQASSLGLLDINYANEFFDEHFLQLLLFQIATGIIIGTVSSVIATARYLKFKTK